MAFWSLHNMRGVFGVKQTIFLSAAWCHWRFVRSGVAVGVGAAVGD